MENWQANLLRFTGFPSKETVVDPENIWKILFEHEPENITQKPREGLTVYQAKHEVGLFELTNNPSRFHLRLFSEANESGLFPPPLGGFNDILSLFKDTLDKLLKSDVCPSLSRVAFGSALVFPVSNKEEGYKILNDLIDSVTLDPKNSSDFFYQINRPRPYLKGIEGLEINRLTKWSVGAVSTVSGLIKVNSSEILSMPSSVSDKEYSVRLELDINTSQKYSGFFDSTNLEKVFSELILFGVEIAKSGDIK